ncbi:response regulator [Sphingobacterium sp.]|uniref:response regulator n=1 Tax=Sphingobacterium sp. TaxID=341027 RepID=UPI00289AEDCD|nr:response regulator [Sphingobacterium sp.]
MDKKIFLCDSNRPVLDALEMVLSLTKAIILSESNSSKVIDQILQEKPDIFVCELEIPGLGGERLIRGIRQYSEYNKLFIICISTSERGKTIATNAGADYFLSKPFDLQELLSVVNKVLATEGR